MSGLGPLPLHPGHHKWRTYSVPSCCYHDAPACGTKQPKTKPSDTWAKINPINCSLRFSGRGMRKLTKVVLCSEYILKKTLQLNINQKNMHVSRKIIWIGVLQGWEMYIHSQHHHWSLWRWKSLHGWNNLVYCDLPAVFEGEMTPHRLMSLNTQIPAGDCVSQGCGILRSSIAEGRQPLGGGLEGLSSSPTCPLLWMWATATCFCGHEFPTVKEALSSNWKPK